VDSLLEQGVEVGGLRRAAHQHPDGDLRLAAEQREPDRTAAHVPDLYHVAAIRTHVDDVAAVHPGMTASDALLTASRDNDSGNHDASGCGLRASLNQHVKLEARSWKR